MSAAVAVADIDPAGDRPHAIHATAVLLGEAGIVIRGRSGAGKSSLALALLELARTQGLFARLIGDDRVLVTGVNGRLMVEAHPAIAGKIERRGLGIVDLPHEGRAVVRLIVDLLDAETCGIPPRLPEAAERTAAIEATQVRRVALRAGASAVELAAQILFELPTGQADA
ncbi:MAG: hypothetical protein JO366_14045 [Methylobacteriaceae bacterium]|nr:hypothetical protein [Methylobacteriaceae bacterium]MBV9218885.1 hypothetical protein [Methylobacteriaceae bacterium]MBV9245926.1 hypothetical protein [Methylobacteriaceae bacterium]MBV9635755.1 hypothetical protein [Methylobacteriaceae bacterium]MBV9705168.1 hypothetical protein [Methylobacteriaceae bacterium]